MERLTQGRLQLTVLDDVVMSIDAEHRLSVCTLLKEDFAGRQFFLTTHDPIWAKQLVRSGLIDKRNLTEFQGWTLEEGAIVAPDGWEKLEELLKVGDVPHAAFALRRLLEAELAEACLALAAHVRYREQGRYDSGELLEGVTARFGDILRKARAAAETWSRQSIVQQIDARLA